MIRVDLDVDNKSKQGCPSKNNLYNFALDGKQVFLRLIWRG